MNLSNIAFRARQAVAHAVGAALLLLLALHVAFHRSHHQPSSGNCLHGRQTAAELNAPTLERVAQLRHEQAVLNAKRDELLDSTFSEVGASWI